MSENKGAIENLKAVLCDPEGNVVISGTDADRLIVREALDELEQLEKWLRLLMPLRNRPNI